MKKYTRCTECRDKMFVGDDCFRFDNELFCCKQCLLDHVDYYADEDEVCEGDMNEEE